MDVPDHLFRAALETMLDCVSICSAVRRPDGRIADFRIDYQNAAACANNNVRAGEQIGKLLCEELPAHRESGLFEDYVRVVETGEPLLREQVFYEDDYNGKRMTRRFDLRATRLGDGFMVAWRDVTAQRAAEDELRRALAALRESEEKAHARAEELAAVLDAAPAAIWIARDVECNEVTGSRSAHEILRVGRSVNLSKTSADPTPLSHFTVWHDGAEVEARNLPLQRAARGEEVRDFDEEIVFSGGDRLQLFGNAKPLLGPDGQPRGAIAAFVDISAVKEAERAVRESDRRKDEFLAMLSHELRNPLAPVRNAVELLLRGKDDRKLVEVIERQTAHLVRLVDDLLDVARVTQGKIELRRAPLELLTVVGHAVETSRPMIDARGHELTLSLPAAPVQLDGDQARLAQSISNLLNNAAKYTPEGGHITLAAETCGTEVRIAVRDDGIGIAPDDLRHVFDLFAQSHRTLDQAQGGLGVGLTLTRRLIEMHGGRIEAHSEGPGRGSEFVITVPLRSTADAPARRVAPSGVARPRRVLVVDDNADAAESIAMLLESDGHVARVAHDGPAALATARTFSPELVLLDLGLPGKNGYQVAELLRADPACAHSFFVALTGFGREEDRKRSTDAGFRAHLTKPIEYAELGALVRDLPA